MVAGKIGIRAGFRDHTLLSAQRAWFAFISGLDRLDWRDATLDIGRQRGFWRSHGACRMEHVVILRVTVYSYGGNQIKTTIKNSHVIFNVDFFSNRILEVREKDIWQKTYWKTP